MSPSPARGRPARLRFHDPARGRPDPDVYSQALPIRGGHPPYTRQLAGSLPLDLALVNGVVTGTPRSPGTFAFTVVATDPPPTVTETFTLPVVVLDRNTALAVDLHRVRLTATADRAPETATVRATGGGPPLSWRISADANWLQIDPASGAAPGTFNVGADTGGVKAGSYSASTTVTMQGAPNSPIRISVELLVK